jgi:hypothetical protein
MFKKRIKVAWILLLTILVLTISCIAVWKISENSKGEGEFRVFMGNAAAAEGVQVSVVTRERVWQTEED